MSFKEKDIKKWMDNQIKAYNLSKVNLYDEEQDVMIRNIGVYDKRIHVSIEGMLEIKMPSMIGKVLVKDRIEQLDYPYEIEVTYKGFKFFTLMSDEEYEAYKH